MKKHIQNPTKVVKRFTKETGLYVSQDFNKFATWVDKKLISGELKGKRVKTLTEATINHIEQEKAYKHSVNLVSKEEFEVYKIIKNHNLISRKGNLLSPKECLNKFLDKKGLKIIENDDLVNACKAYILLPTLKMIIEQHLIEELKAFCNPL